MQGTYDIELIYTKCPEISAEWLLTGEGKMLKQHSQQLKNSNNNLNSNINGSVTGNVTISHNDSPMPIITNQKTNEYLKELMMLAGINDMERETYYIGNRIIDRLIPKYKLIGTHAARRTFICTALGYLFSTTPMNTYLVGGYFL